MYLSMFAPLYTTPLAYLIITAIIVVSVVALRKSSLFDACRMHPYSVYRGRRMFTVFTSVCVHTGWLHLLLNAVFLVIYLPEIEYMLNDDFGPFWGGMLLLFVVTFIASFASMCSAVQHRQDRQHWSTGSSHVVFGAMTLYFVYFPIDDGGTVPKPLPVVPGFLIALIILSLLFLLTWLDWAAAAPMHFYGALAGLLLACMIRPALIGELFENVRPPTELEESYRKSDGAEDKGAYYAVSGSPSERTLAPCAALDGV